MIGNNQMQKNQQIEKNQLCCLSNLISQSLLDLKYSHFTSMGLNWLPQYIQLYVQVLTIEQQTKLRKTQKSLFLPYL